LLRVSSIGNPESVLFRIVRHPIPVYPGFYSGLSDIGVAAPMLPQEGGACGALQERSLDARDPGAVLRLAIEVFVGVV
jgi:hypothetical protein